MATLQAASSAMAQMPFQSRTRLRRLRRPAAPASGRGGGGLALACATLVVVEPRPSWLLVPDLWCRRRRDAFLPDPVIPHPFQAPNQNTRITAARCAARRTAAAGSR